MNSTTGTTFNSQQVEECDFNEDKGIILQRLLCHSHEATHKVLINSHKILLTANLSPDLPPAIATRHDVDSCLWQPCSDGFNFTIEHVGTLNAFGYVQASKQERKFSECAPDLSYTVVCESNRHLLIYRQNKTVTSGELRHRSTGKRTKTIAQQQVLTLQDGEVLGINATVKFLFVLTEKRLIVFKM